MQKRAWSYGATVTLALVQEAAVGGRGEGSVLHGLPPSPSLLQQGALLVVQPQVGAVPKQILPTGQHPWGPRPVSRAPREWKLCHEGTRAASTQSKGPPCYRYPPWGGGDTSHNVRSGFGILHGLQICSFLSHSEGIWANCCYVYSLSKAGAESLFSILERGISIFSF